MRKISLIFQEILKFLLLFLLSFIWIRYFLRSLALSIALSILISAVVYAILFLFSRKKRNFQGLKIKEKEEAENMFLSLCTSKTAIDFFAELASKKHENVTKHKEYVVINHEKEKVKTILFANLTFTGLDVARFVEIYNKIQKEKATKLVITCHSVADKQLFVFLKNFNEKILIFDQYETYQQLYKTYDFFPKITQKYAKQSKMTFKDMMFYSFNKKRAKGYLFSAFVLVLSSLFMRATIYYCIIASMLVIFAILSQFNLFKTRELHTEIL